MLNPFRFVGLVELDKYVRGWGNGLPEARVTRKPAPATPDRVLSFLANDAENVTRSFPLVMACHTTRTTHSAYSMSDARRTGRVISYDTICNCADRDAARHGDRRTYRGAGQPRDHRLSR